MKKYIASLYDHDECLEITLKFARFSDLSIFLETWFIDMENSQRAREISWNVCYAEED